MSTLKGVVLAQNEVTIIALLLSGKNAYISYTILQICFIQAWQMGIYI